MTESLRIPGRLLGFYSFPNPRRSREVTHICSVRVTHQKCGLLIRKSIARVALSSAPKACRWINSHEHTRVTSRECRRCDLGLVPLSSIKQPQAVPGIVNDSRSIRDS